MLFVVSKSMMMQLAGMWMKPSDWSKDSNTLISMARCAQLTGSQEIRPLSLIKLRRTSSSPRSIRTENLRRSQSILKIFPPTAPSSGSARSTREPVLSLPTASQSKCTTQAPCSTVINSTHPEIADKLSSSLLEEDRLLNAGNKVLLSWPRAREQFWTVLPIWPTEREPWDQSQPIQLLDSMLRL